MLQDKKGFTLIELIVTIAILAVLVTIVVLAINPAEQLARSRDSKRVGDLDTLRSAINLYLAQATATIALGGSSEDNCDGNDTTDTIFTTNSSLATTTGFQVVTATTNQSIGSSGWLPARMDQTPGGAPISNLPLDPTNGTTYYYNYACQNTPSPTTYEITAKLESTYFSSDLDVDGKDGGNSSDRYEVGSKLNILPSTAGY